MNLSKTKYCSGIICKKKLWLDTFMPKVKSGTGVESVLENGKAVGELAKNLFGDHIDIEFDENLTKMLMHNRQKPVLRCNRGYRHCVPFR